MIVIKVGNRYPKNCGTCKLFVSEMGHTAYCIAKGDYTAKEIREEKDGSLSMYYHGYLKHRPKNCPLIEIDGGDQDD